MCRMFVALNPKNVEQLLIDFVPVSEGKNETHEKKALVGAGHDSGCGITWLSDKGFPYLKVAEPYFAVKDFMIEQFRNLKSKVLIVHARKGPNVCLENAHPFLAKQNRKEWVFCHNGTIRDKLEFSDQYNARGTTDSEKFFYKILSQEINPKNLKKITGELKNYSAANFILASHDKLYVNCQFKECLFYYTMKLFQDCDEGFANSPEGSFCKTGNEIIVSSEVLKSKERWLAVPNKTLIEIDIKTANINYF